MIRTCNILALSLALSCAASAQFEPQARVAMRELHAEEFVAETITLFTLSRGAAVIRVAYTVDTAWAISSGLNIGDAEDPKGWMESAAINEVVAGDGYGFLQSQAGGYLATTGDFKRFSEVRAITATIVGALGGEAVGSLRIYVFYIECP